MVIIIANKPTRTMMRILSIGKTLQHTDLSITFIKLSDLQTDTDLSKYDYIIISGGDGSIRRVVKLLHERQQEIPIILNPAGSFNVIAKIHHAPKIETILKALSEGKIPAIRKQPYYSLNQEIFLFSAGNMGDLQHIFLSETLRFGWMKNNMGKYILALLFLLPMHLIITPFMLLSSNRFFIFTPLSFIKKFGSFYGEVKEMTIELENEYNHIELDGDIVTIEDSVLHIKPACSIDIVIR